MPENQSAVLEFLLASGGRPVDGGRPDTVHTHISVIVRFAETVLKLKRALSFPYLDFSTPEKRYLACLKELDLNRRAAPELYLGVHRITRAPEGGLEFDGAGELVDAVLLMRRFDDAGLLANMARLQKLDNDLMTRVASAIVRSHQSAPVVPFDNGAARLRNVLAMNRQSEAVTMNVLGNDWPQRLNMALARRLEEHALVLDARAARGKVRHCHGDLHLGNVCVYQGEPVLFDCLEFNDDMATIDVLYDLAFVLMDLWYCGQPAFANWVMNRYLDDVDELDGLPLLPFFMALRAAIRGQVLATQSGQARDAGDEPRAIRCADQSRSFIELAFQLLEVHPVVLLAVGGLSGSGKSTMAAAVAHQLGPVPGARVLSSDRLRKRMFSVSAQTRLPSEAYTSPVSARVYAQQIAQAEQVLGLGVAVVADAVFSRTEGRDAIQRAAERAGVPFIGIWLDVPQERLLERVVARQNDPSDATQEVVESQLAADIGPINWLRISTEGTIEEVSVAVLGVIGSCFA